MSGEKRLDSGPLTEEQVLAATEVLERANVAKLLQSAGQDLVTDERLLSSRLSDSMDVHTIRRFLTALIGPLADVIVQVQPGFSYWVYPTLKIRRTLSFVDVSCTAHSPMALWLRDNPAALVQLRLESAITSSRMDGLEIDFESAKELLLLSREPRNKPERIVANSFQLFGETESYARREYSVDLLLELFARLSEGVQVPEDWLDAPLAAPLSPSVYPHPNPRTVLEQLCLMANGKLASPDVHPMLVGILMERVLTVYNPFPLLNGTMGRLLWHYFAVSAGYPVLGAIPYSSALNELPRTPGPLTVPPADERASRVWRPDADVTPLIDHRLRVVEQAILDLQQRMETKDAQHQALRILLTSDPALNRRQRSIIGRALRIPSATFRIPYHQTSHSIAYSTARADFVELEEKGYLMRERQGHAFVYRAAPDLRERMGKRAAEAIGHSAALGVWGTTR